MARPKVNSQAQEELDKAQESLDKFTDEVKSLTSNPLSSPEDHEPQTKMSSKQFAEAPEIYLKPIKTIYPGSAPKTGKMHDVFNEKYRDQWEYDKKYVRFIAENHEIIGDSIDIWTRPYPGLPAEEWMVPANKPIWGPRYLAEQIKRKCYNVLSMDEHRVSSSDQAGTYVGSMVVKQTKHRLDAQPAPKQQISFNHKESNF